MDARRTLMLHAWLQIALWVGIALVANHLSSTFYVRADLTANHRFTLSDVARHAVADLEQPLVARVYFTDELEAPYHNHKQALTDKLEELRAFSGGHMELSVVDPAVEKALMEEAESQGVVSIPYRFRNADRYEAKQVFMHVALFYGGQTKVLGPMVSTRSMEYELVRAILDLRTPREDRKTLAYLSGIGGPELLDIQGDNPMTALRASLTERYNLVAITLGGDEPVPDQVDALMVIGPQRVVSDRAQYQIDQFIMSGKPVSFFAQSMRPDMRSLRAVPVRHNLNGLIGNYGVKLNKDTLFDRDHGEVFPFPTRSGRTVDVDYPLIPYTTKLNRDNPLVSRIDKAKLPFASSLTLSEELPASVTASLLIESEDSSARVQSLMHISPEVFKLTAPGEEPGPHPVAFALTGRFTSFFADRPIPPPEGTSPDDPGWQPDPTEKILDGRRTRLLVVGSADFVANNPVFMQNTVDWMLEDTGLLDIRASLAEADGMLPPTASEARTLKAGVVLVPLLLLLALGGLIALISRRRA